MIISSLLAFRRLEFSVLGYPISCQWPKWALLSDWHFICWRWQCQCGQGYFHFVSAIVRKMLTYNGWRIRWHAFNLSKYWAEQKKTKANQTKEQQNKIKLGIKELSSPAPPTHTFRVLSARVENGPSSQLLWSSRCSGPYPPSSSSSTELCFESDIQASLSMTQVWGNFF